MDRWCAVHMLYLIENDYQHTQTTVYYIHRALYMYHFSNFMARYHRNHPHHQHHHQPHDDDDDDCR